MKTTKNDNIAAIKESFRLKSNSSVEFEDGMEHLERDLEAPQPLAAPLRLELISSQLKGHTPHHNNDNLVGPGESVPPRNPSTPSRLQPDCDNSNFYESKPDLLTQNPPNNSPQYRCHMRPQQYVYRHYHNLPAPAYWEHATLFGNLLAITIRHRRTHSIINHPGGIHSLVPTPMLTAQVTLNLNHNQLPR